MSNKKDIIILVLVLVAGMLLLVALDRFTSPLIEKNRENGENAPLFAVLPGSSGFEKMSLLDAPDTITALYKEKNGLGYAVKARTNKGFTGNYITLTLGISSEGRIVGITLDEYPETKDFGSDYPLSYIGEDSTLSGVEIVAGVTYSSSAFKNAVNDAFTYLVSKGLVKGKEKSPEQKFDEALSSLFPEALNPKGLPVTEDFTSSVPGVLKAEESGNKAAAAYLIEENGAYYIAVTSLYSLRVYDIDSDETDALSNEVRDALVEEAGEMLKSYTKSDLKKVKRLGSLSADALFTELSLESVESSVTTAFSVEDGGSRYYAFVSRPYGFGNETMVMYTLLTEDGRIADFSVKELIIEADYFSSYTLRDDYYTSFRGLDSSWSGDEALVTGATLTTDAVKEGINDAFSAYKILSEDK